MNRSCGESTICGIACAERKKLTKECGTRDSGAVYGLAVSNPWNMAKDWKQYCGRVLRFWPDGKCLPQ